MARFNCHCGRPVDVPAVQAASKLLNGMVTVLCSDCGDPRNSRRIRAFTLDPQVALMLLNAGTTHQVLHLPIHRFPDDARVIDISYSPCRRAFEIQVYSSEYAIVGDGGLVPMEENHHIALTDLDTYCLVKIGDFYQAAERCDACGHEQLTEFMIEPASLDKPAQELHEVLCKIEPDGSFTALEDSRPVDANSPREPDPVAFFFGRR